MLKKVEVMKRFSKPDSKKVSLFAAARKSDPARIIPLQRMFFRDALRRINNLANSIYELVAKMDVFGLSPSSAQAFTYQQASSSRPRRFDKYVFRTSKDKIETFMQWLDEQHKNGLLELVKHQQLGFPIEEPWANIYIKRAYEKGITRARSELRKIQRVPDLSKTGGLAAALQNPFHADRLGVLYTRTFGELKGITSSLDTLLSRVLTEGIAMGINPVPLARNLVKAVTGEGGSLSIVDRMGRFIPAKRRALILTRTEIMRVHHAATVQEYRNWGVEGVEVKAEWFTAGDDRICDQCARLEGTIYTLDDIEPLIPYHPQCRCVAIPVSPKRAAGRGRKKKEAAPAGEAAGAVSPVQKVEEKVVEETERQKLLRMSGDEFAQKANETLDACYAEAEQFVEEHQRIVDEINRLDQEMLGMGERQCDLQYVQIPGLEMKLAAAVDQAEKDRIAKLLSSLKEESEDIAKKLDFMTQQQGDLWRKELESRNKIMPAYAKGRNDFVDRMIKFVNPDGREGNVGTIKFREIPEVPDIREFSESRMFKKIKEDLEGLGLRVTKEDIESHWKMANGNLKSALKEAYPTEFVETEPNLDCFIWLDGFGGQRIRDHYVVRYHTMFVDYEDAKLGFASGRASPAFENVVHEYGHHIEYLSPSVNKGLCESLFEYGKQVSPTGQIEIKKLSEVAQSGFFREDEVCIPVFEEVPYASKIYKQYHEQLLGRDYRPTEMLSMFFQTLFGRTEGVNLAADTKYASTYGKIIRKDKKFLSLVWEQFKHYLQ